MSIQDKLGQILHDPCFEFNDGEVGNKLIIVLGRCCKADNYIVVRTTSKPDRKSWEYGCHNNEPDPNFFIPVTLGLFPLDTWVCLDYLTDLDVVEFNKGLTNKDRFEKGQLSINVLKNLLDCASRADDTTQYQSQILRDVLATLK